MYKKDTETLLYCQSNGEGKDVVLLHGILSTHAYWEALSSILSKTNKVHAIDLLGAGRSPALSRATSYTPEAHLLYIHKTINHCIKNRTFTLVGHSMGSILAIKYALAYPDKIDSLILISVPFLEKSSMFENLISELFGVGLQGRMAAIGIYGRLLVRGPLKRLAPVFMKQYPRSIVLQSLDHRPRQYRHTLKHAVYKDEVLADLTNIQVPTKILVADNDKIAAISVEDIIALNNFNLKYKQVRGGHNIPLDQPEIVASEI